MNKNKQLFLGERYGEIGVWQFPQGGVESEGSLEENVIREAAEETGADAGCFRIVRRMMHTHRYDFSHAPAYAEGKFRGQQQTFWIVEFLGDDKEIDLEKSEQEFQSWRWASVHQVRELAERKRLPGYEGALSEFSAGCVTG